jgi:hypothetical protein
MAKRQELNSRIDAKQFFEASVSALREESKSIESKSAEARSRNRALVQRTATDEALIRRAVDDAARALTALWKMQPSTRTV